jgi:4-hydroxyphenylpyruvate dioxygenase
VQHIALLTNDILSSVEAVGSAVEMLDIDDGYYHEAFARVPSVREDRARIEKNRVLLDGDADGYLLQIFTKNVIGPIFFEIIQRENHHSFGEGNFSALFRSIERDQEKRGVL